MIVHDRKPELRLVREDDSPTELPRVPAEIGLLIMAVGLVGLVLPGPIGTPLVISGGLSLWPGTFRPAERWLARNCPGTHRSGAAWLERFRSDLERRYPSDASSFACISPADRISPKVRTERSADE